MKSNVEILLKRIHDVKVSIAELSIKLEKLRAGGMEPEPRPSSPDVVSEAVVEQPVGLGLERPEAG